MIKCQTRIQRHLVHQGNLRVDQGQDRDHLKIGVTWEETNGESTVETKEEEMIDSEESQELSIHHMIVPCIPERTLKTIKTEDSIEASWPMLTTNTAKHTKKSKNTNFTPSIKLTPGLLKDTIQVRFLRVNKYKRNLVSITQRDSTKTCSILSLITSICQLILIKTKHRIITYCTIRREKT